jgi:hypothetical protein
MGRLLCAGPPPPRGIKSTARWRWVVCVGPFVGVWLRVWVGGKTKKSFLAMTYSPGGLPRKYHRRWQA